MLKSRTGGTVNERINDFFNAAQQLVEERGSEKGTTSHSRVNGRYFVDSRMYVDEVVHIEATETDLEVRLLENGNPVLQVKNLDEDPQLLRWHGQGYWVENHLRELVGFDLVEETR